jgi:hypothetical protein
MPGLPSWRRDIASASAARVYSVVAGFPASGPRSFLPPHVAIRVPWLDRHYPASSLLWTHPTPRMPRFRGYVFPQAFAVARRHGGLSVPDLVCRHAPSPSTPESRTVASTRFFTVRAGFTTSDGMATLTSLTRLIWVRLTLRLALSPNNLGLRTADRSFRTPSRLHG